MLNSLKLLRPWARRCLLALIIGLASGFVGMANPAVADSLLDTPKYLSADGRDLTAMAECLPKQLSQSNLDRALQESKNDFLEKVFDTKSNYNDYKLDETELEYIACMESKGVVPQIKR